MSDDERWIVAMMDETGVDLQNPIWFKTYKEAMVEYNETKPDLKRGEEVFLLHVSRKKPHSGI